MNGIVSQPLVIRADANTSMGTGHVMRCLALAQAWQDAERRAVFVMATEVPALETRLQSEGMRVVHLSARPGSGDDAIKTADLAREIRASWLVVDGYHFGGDYQRIIKDSGFRLLGVDDNGHADHYCADVVLNQNLHAHEGLYENRESYTRLLLGTRYVLLRREFLKWRGWNREIPQVARKVLVTLGGGDPDNVTLKVIQALQRVEVEGLEAVVVIGPISSDYQELQTAVQHSPPPIRLEQNATNMPALMAWADAAVSAGGSTSWELAFMGLPSAILVLADNQDTAVQVLAKREVVVSLGHADSAEAEDIAQTLTRVLRNRGMRHQLSQKGRRVVDGSGAFRVIEVLSKGRPILRV